MLLRAQEAPWPFAPHLSFRLSLLAFAPAGAIRYFLHSHGSIYPSNRDTGWDRSDASHAKSVALSDGPNLGAGGEVRCSRGAIKFS